MSNIEPGWYQAQGDPPGTQRYWDGSQWIGEPQPVGGQGAGTGSAAGGGYGVPADFGAGVAHAGTVANVPRPTEESPVGWFRLWLSRWSDFQGRSRRAEYWWPQLFILGALIAVVVLIGALGAILGEAGFAIGSLLYFVFAIGLIVPALSSLVRRLHDTGKSGWWVLLSLVPLASLVLLVFCFMDSERGANQYGPSPKYN